MASTGRNKTSLQRVSKGGLWHTPPVNYSKETQETLAVVMKEAKLTVSQQKQLKDSLSDADTSLPTRKPKSSFKGKNPFVCNSSRKPPAIKTVKSGIRTKEKIINSGCYEVDPLPITASTNQPCREKEKLQNIMAFGTDIGAKKPTSPDFEPEIPLTPEERFRQVLSEIEERKEFLQEMKRLGVANQYSDVIRNQIAEKLQELELLDKEANKTASEQILPKNTTKQS